MFGIILVFGILTGTRFAYAASDKPETESSRQKCYESIMIYFGDTLESVADTYRTEEYPDVDSFISEICQINHLKEHTALVPGNYIIIPSYCSVSGQ